jgi:hypothetical protein
MTKIVNYTFTVAIFSSTFSFLVIVEEYHTLSTPS